MANAKEGTEAEKAFWDQLVRHRLVVPSGVQGVFGRGAVFEDVLEKFNAAVTRSAAADGCDVFHFPPVLSRKVFEKSEYLDSFPHLAGTIFSFEGDDAKHKLLQARLKEKGDWSEYQSMTDLVLTPACCYPIYPTFTGTLPENGRSVDMTSYVFRHEPSPDPARMQMFRIREFVRTGTPDVVVAWRDTWLKRGHQLLVDCGLPAKPEVAADPFFGRGGRMLKVNQKEAQLKFEVVVPICSEESPTAVVSFNYHQEHFGHLFDIKTHDNATAHTACLGFGLERVVMALFKTHGMQPAEWPQAVRQKLWP